MSDEWARAFALQAVSDLQVHALLASSTSDKCRKLHLLQMAAENTCKAYLIARSGYDALSKMYCVIAKTLPLIFRETLIQQRHSEASIRTRVKFAKLLGAEIQLLSPSCNSGGTREGNSEYPWLTQSGTVGIPCQFPFSNIAQSDRHFISFIKLLSAAAQSYAAEND